MNVADSGRLEEYAAAFTADGRPPAPSPSRRRSTSGSTTEPVVGPGCGLPLMDILRKPAQLDTYRCPGPLPWCTTERYVRGGGDPAGTADHRPRPQFHRGRPGGSVRGRPAPRHRAGGEGHRVAKGRHTASTVPGSTGAAGSGVTPGTGSRPGDRAAEGHLPRVVGRVVRSLRPGPRGCAGPEAAIAVDRRVPDPLSQGLECAGVLGGAPGEDSAVGATAVRGPSKKSERSKTETDAAHRGDPSAGTEFTAQAADVRIYRPAGFRFGVAPHLGHDLFPRKYTARP